MGKKQLKYETFEHIADIGVRGYGKTLEESFSNCAKALFSILFENFDEFNPEKSLEFQLESVSLEGLLVKWLNQLIAISQIENMVFSDFKLKIDGYNLFCEARGNLFQKDKYRMGTEVKGATFCEARVEQKEDYFISQCVVDV